LNKQGVATIKQALCRWGNDCTINSNYKRTI